MPSAHNVVLLHLGNLDDDDEDEDDDDEEMMMMMMWRKIRRRRRRKRRRRRRRRRRGRERKRTIECTVYRQQPTETGAGAVVHSDDAARVSVPR
jgi:hypothetical protein